MILRSCSDENYKSIEPLLRQNSDQNEAADRRILRMQKKLGKIFKKMNFLRIPSEIPSNSVGFCRKLCQSPLGSVGTFVGIRRFPLRNSNGRCRNFICPILHKIRNFNILISSSMKPTSVKFTTTIGSTYMAMT